MSLLQSQIIGTIETFAAKVTASTATVVVDATEGVWLVGKMQVNENSGATPNLTVDLYDVANTTAYYQGAGGSTWVAKAVTAKQSIEFTDIEVPIGWQLRVTSSDAAGKFDVVGLKARRITG
jgi:hypothetical protein